jgi:hypothetical protein
MTSRFFFDVNSMVDRLLSANQFEMADRSPIVEPIRMKKSIDCNINDLHLLLRHVTRSIKPEIDRFNPWMIYLVVSTIQPTAQGMNGIL